MNLKFFAVLMANGVTFTTLKNCEICNVPCKMKSRLIFSNLAKLSVFKSRSSILCHQKSHTLFIHMFKKFTKCVLKRKLIFSNIPNKFNPILDMREEFRAEPKDTDAVLEEDVVLECSPPRGHPKPVVKWKKDGDNLDLTSAKRIKIDESGNLVIYKAQKKDQGRYQCTAENVASTKTSKPMRLKVHGKYHLNIYTT